MKRLFVILSLVTSFSLSAFAANTCQFLNKEIIRAQIEVKNSKIMFEKQKELAGDALKVSRASKILYSVSLLSLTPLSAVAIPGVAVGFTLVTESLEEDAELIHYAQTSTFESINETIDEFNQLVDVMNAKRKDVDLNYSRIRNALSFGSRAKISTAQLANIAKSVNLIYQKKLKYLLTAKQAHRCE